MNMKCAAITKFTKQCVFLACCRYNVRVPPLFVPYNGSTMHQEWKPESARFLFSLSTPYFLKLQADYHVSAIMGRACDDRSLTEAEYENLVKSTLESLADFLEDLPLTVNCAKDYDVTLGDGVLTLHMGGSQGTYVINKQTPNQQIWLSSPTSGPKRYDYVDGRWLYRRDGQGIHTLLEKELSAALKTTIDLSSCTLYS